MVANQNVDVGLKGVVTVIILTFNEQVHIERALRSARQLSQDVVVVDSGSTDSTVEVCKAYGARIYQHEFINQAKQLKWALESIPVDTPWMLRLDADEIIEDELISDLKEKLSQFGDDVSGLVIARKHYFMGRWIRFGGRFPLYLLRAWRTGRGVVDDRWMDEHMFVTNGCTVHIERGCLIDWNLRSIDAFVEKHNRYASREAIEVLNRQYRLFEPERPNAAMKGVGQAELKRVLKEILYNNTPFVIAGTSYFVWRYIIRLGFLDGIPGFVYHFMQGWWYRTLVGIKVREMQVLIRRDPSRAKAIVSDYTNIVL